MLLPKQSTLLVTICLLVSQISEFSFARRGARRWESAMELSRNIMQKYETMERVELFHQLALVRKSLVGEIRRPVPPTFILINRDYIIPVLCLVRLTDLSLDKCIETNLVVDKGNLHRNNYIDLIPVLHSYFKSDYMRQIIDSYYQSQLQMCRNALGAQLGQKITDFSVGYDRKDFTNFMNPLVASFPAKGEINQMDKSKKLESLVDFIGRKLKRGDIKQGLADRRSFVGVYQNAVAKDCRSYFLEPLGTMMRTLEVIGRPNMPEIQQKFEKVVRAYDICSEIRKLPDYDLTRILTKSLKYSSAKGSSKYPSIPSHWPSQDIIDLTQIQGSIRELITQQPPQQATQPHSEQAVPKNPVGFGSSAFRRFDGTQIGPDRSTSIVPGAISQPDEARANMQPQTVKLVDVTRLDDSSDDSGHSGQQRS